MKAITPIRQLPISEYQKRFFLEWALAPKESAYNVSLVNKIVSGTINELAIEQACGIFVKKHEITHAQYTPDGKSCHYASFSEDDFYHRTTLNPNQPVEPQIRAILDQPFDLTKDPLLRLHLVESKNEFYFIILAHHIIADAISALQISLEIEEVYNLIIGGEPGSIDLEKTFTRAVESEQKVITDEYRSNAQKFWLDLIADTPLNINLPYRSDVKATDFNNILANKTGGFIYFELTSDQTEQLKAYSKQKRTTPFIVLSALYGLVLSKYSNQQRLLLSYPINMRPRGFSEVISCFVNNVPLKLELDKVDTLEALIQQLGAQRRTVKKHQGYSLIDIIQDQRMSRKEEIKKFFNVGFTQANLNTASLKLKGLEIIPVDISNSDKIVNEIGLLYDAYSSDVVKFKFEYRKALFDEVFIRKFIDSFKKILSEVINGREILLKDYSVLSPEEYQKTVCDWNDTDKNYPKEKTIVELFQEQAAQTPEHVALVDGEKEFSYRELNEKSNQLARHIRAQYKKRTKQELQPDTLIGLYLNRSVEMLIGILAILKAGGAYVPIDINSPKKRIDYLLEDTDTALILCEQELEEEKNLQLPQDKIIPIDVWEAFYKVEDTANLSPQSKASDLAYVIYTSGTTGKPKGVMIEHHAVCNYVNNVKAVFLEDISKVDFSSNIAFDLTVTTTICSLLLGKTIFVYTGALSDTDLYTQHLVNNKIDFLKSTPSLLASLPLDQFGDYKIKQAFIGGEKLSGFQLAHIAKFVDNPIDEYGPTEATVGTTCINKRLAKSNKSIGKPYANYKTYVLDVDNTPVPIGVIGELHIGGGGLARGYLNRPELTEERFITNPFASETDLAKGNTRLYKTGDLVRWLSDGNLEYIGRNDDQVKIRGYRVELGEIEYALSQVEGIKQSCVLAKAGKTGRHNYLVAYYILESSDQELRQTNIEEELSQVLPEYMIPSAYMQMDSFPLTSNGKLDKQALPDPNFNSSAEEYIAPTTEVETTMCRIFQEVLGVDRISIKDDFFKIGGNSILAIQVVHEIARTLGCELKVTDIYELKTVEKLSVFIQSSAKVDFKYQDYLITTGFVDANNAFELSNVQQAYLYGRFGSVEIGNVSTHSYTELLFNRFDSSRFEAALNKLIKRHSVLRTIFKAEAQYILPEVPYYPVNNHQKISPSELTEIRDRLSHKIYKVDAWPLFDFEVSEHEGKRLLHVSFDALIMDATSMGLFFNELTQLYNATDMDEVKLPELQVNFRDYMQKYGEVRSSTLFSDAAKYWKAKLADYSFDAQLPLVMNPSKVDHPKFVRITKTIPDSNWQLIQSKAKRHNISPTAVVLYAYGQVLTKWSGQSKFCVNLTLFNRLPLHEQVNSLLGDFTVLELFNFKRGHKANIQTAIAAVHQELWNDIEHNLFDGIDFQRLIRKESGIAQNQSLSPVVLTSVLGNKNANITIDGYEGMGYSITQTSQVYLDNKAYDTTEGFIAEWDYVEQLFDPEVIQQMHAAYCDLLMYLSGADWEAFLPSIGLSALDQSVIATCNSDAQPAVSETLIDLCLSSVVDHSDRTAVVDAKGTYTYQEVGDYSYRIAGYLQDHHLSKTSHLIGILSEKGYGQVVAALGIMQSSSAYLPLHVDWPLGRIDEVLEEGLVQTVLVSESIFAKLVKGSKLETKYTWLVIETVINYDPRISLSELPKVELDDIAYVIFTSGSTGKPKGVTISHRGAVNTIVAVNEKFEVSKEDKILALSELSFDLSVYDIFGLLDAGGTIVFPDQQKTKEPKHWNGLVERHGITLWNTVPQLMQLLVDYAMGSEAHLASLRAVMMSGDWIAVTLPNQIKRLNAGIRVMSLGGATEGSIWSIWYEVDRVASSWRSIPYGVAMPNQKMYVLNEFMEHCPMGVIGDIYIGGEGVALGYWGDEKQTNERFIETDDLGRLYKTGDLGRWNNIGYIEFEGRKDTQVKLNGYRVELEEISSKLTKVGGIDKSLVNIQENQLVAYLVSEKYGAKSEKEEGEGIDKVAFKFEQKGIKKEVPATYRFAEMDLDENRYRLRKSYRQFEAGKVALTKEEVDNLLDENRLTIGSKNGKFSGHGQRHKVGNGWLDRLKELLKPLSALQLEDKVLPKYLYPSGGSTYGIQCYVAIGEEVGTLNSGTYYYEPVSHYLSLIDKSHMNGQAKSNDQMASPIRLQFKLYKPAIEPLYGGMGLKLAWLEMGHILSFLDQQCQFLNLDGDLKVVDKAEDDYHDLVELSINLSNDKSVSNTLGFALEKESEQSSIDFLRKAKDGFSDEEGHEYALSSNDLFSRISELGQLLDSADGLLLFKGDPEPKNLLRSGYQAQVLTDALYAKGIGSCVLGFAPYEGVHYSIAIGQVTEEQKKTSEIQAKKVSIASYLKSELREYLPEYMLPEYYIPLAAFPLTGNGKVDYKRLPKVEIRQEEYVAPSTEIESSICAVWEETLGLDRVGVTDDFFRIGGDSILAIRLSHRMSKVLGYELKVADVFKLRTINDLLENFNAQKVNEKNVRWEF